MSEQTIKDFRVRIDSLDDRVLELISERAFCAQEVARAKIASVATGEVPIFYRPEREIQVLKRMIKRNKGPLSNEEIVWLFREIMSSCLALEQPLKVAYLGSEGNFTQLAAMKYFGHAVISKPIAAIDELFCDVVAGVVKFGVVPISNSTEELVDHMLDSFFERNMVICGEVDLRIQHHLLVCGNTKTNRTTSVYSHTQSLVQCSKWLYANYPNVERVTWSSDAEAAKLAQSNEWNSASITGDMVESPYRLTSMVEKIEDLQDNFTRFLIIGSEEIPPTGDDKTSIIVSMSNRPEALYKLLVPFYEHRIDLTRIEVRLARSSKSTYMFFVDFIGHCRDSLVKDVLEQVSHEALTFKILGSYPKAVL
ncbi:chorismate mutase [Candidatus Pseudomonas adelgestsugas]|uniref:Bifunctional chorismate mutase/prephenate dehydratase n=1 Tax=Candidatus Pseudomonas adelgestsugas TaxID=1302376 RepID=A0ABX5R9I3_9PSED|nr:chorismate mutase [Candidatus Pseudomonas adelgestsugas]QAX82019.1 P-protein [Candidatus Pseudomonas adelgestsugas]